MQVHGGTLDFGDNNTTVKLHNNSNSALTFADTGGVAKLVFDTIGDKLGLRMGTLDLSTQNSEILLANHATALKIGKSGTPLLTLDTATSPAATLAGDFNIGGDVTRVAGNLSISAPSGTVSVENAVFNGNDVTIPDKLSMTHNVSEITHTAASSSDGGAASIAASHPSAPSRAHSAATADGGHAASSTTDPAAASAGGATGVLALPHGGAAGAGGGADGAGGALGTGGTVGGAGGGAGGDGGGDGAALATSSCNVRSLNASTHVALSRSHGVSDTHSPGWPGMSRCACSVQHASTRTGVAHVAPDAMDRVAPGGQSSAASVARCSCAALHAANGSRRTSS